MSRPSIILKLPVPPSVNGMYATARGRRIKSRKYRAWLTEAGWELQRQKVGCVGGPWEIDVALPADLRGDIDNRCKAILDLLVKHRVVDDDKHCQRLSVAKAVTVASVVITITRGKTP
jgi:crossover junction endodeoxyribonuclease RusA